MSRPRRFWYLTACVILTFSLLPLNDGGVVNAQNVLSSQSPTDLPVLVGGNEDALVAVEDLPVPLPRDCDALTPPGGDPPSCCLYGYVYYNDVPAAGVTVRIESAHGSVETTTAVGGASSDPYYQVNLSGAPLLASAGETITITASYSDMVSTRTWTVQAGAQQVDVGLVAGYRSSGVTSLVDGVRESGPLFIPNVGQFDNRALFQVRSRDRIIWLTENALWMITLEHPEPMIANMAGEPWDSGEMEQLNIPQKGVAIRLSFAGANPHPRIEPSGRLETSVNYLTGNDPTQWQLNIPAWREVRYLDLYPGVDMEVAGDGGQLVLRLITQSDIRPSEVRLRVEGADGVDLGDDGLLLHTILGQVALPFVPFPVEGSSAGQIQVQQVGEGTFEVDLPLDSTPSPSASDVLGSPLISDSGQSVDLLFATFLGGSVDDYGHDVVVDSNGYIYIGGVTYSPDFPATPGAFDTTFAGPSSSPGGDAYIAKLSPDGSTLVYATFIGGSGRDWIHSIAVDASGAVYATGETSSSDFPVTSGSFDTSYNGGLVDAFVLKLDPTGSNLMYSTYLGGSHYEGDMGTGIAIDGDGAAYVAGITWSSDFPSTSGAFDTSQNGLQDAFVAKLDPSGSTLVYATFLGGSQHDMVYRLGIDVDALGAAYVAGITWSLDFPTTSAAYDTTFNGGEKDAFVAKVSPSGDSLIYSTFLGGGDDDEGLDIAVDQNGNAYVTGGTRSDDFPVTAGAFDTSPNGNYDVFVAQLNPTGDTLAYSSFIGGSSYDMGRGIAIDGSGTVYVTGETHSSDFPVTSSALDTTFNGGSADAFVVKLDTSDSRLVYSSFLGGTGVDGGQGDIAVGGSGLVYVSGSTTSLDFPTTSGAYDTSHNGGYDAFAISMDIAPPGFVAPSATFTASPLTGAAPLEVHFTDQSTGDIVAWTWHFGDGGISGARHPLHVYEFPGTYTVSLTVSGPAGSDTETKTNYINVSSSAKTWTFILYFAGDNNLHPYLERAIDRMERVANRSNLTILVLWDGWRSSDTRLYRVIYDTAPGIASPILSVPWNSGELNTGNSQTLVDFVNWARANYPADHYFLSIANHGRGTTGIAWDDTSGGDNLSAYSELASALDAITSGGSNKIDVLYFDACLMGMIEDAYEVKDYVDYLVASENLGWSVFAYDRYVGLVGNDTTPQQLAQGIADEYFNALYNYPGTVSALDLAAIGNVGSAVDQLAQALDNFLTPSNVSQIITIRNNVQTFDSRNYQVLDSTDEYIDLYHFAELVKASISDGTVQNAAQAVMDAIGAAMVAEHHRSGQDPWSGNYWDLDDAHGVAVFFPPRSNGWDYMNYVTGGSWTFCTSTAWDEFLVSYFQMSGLPPETPTDPGIPTMLEMKYQVFLPFVVRGH